MKKFLCVLFLVTALTGCREAPKPTSKHISSHLGVRTIQYQDEARDRPIVVELWHPTDVDLDNPQELSVWIHPHEVRNAPISAHQRPLIIMSHGNGGERRDASWLAERLVKQGYIVASVEHYGNSATTYNPGAALRFWDRSQDVSFVIDKLFKEPSLDGKIDPNRVGFIGYSLGGMTGLSLAGAKAQNVKEVALQLQKVRKDLSPEMIERADFSAAYQNLHEDRIKAVALIFPATFVYPTDGLKSIKTPVAVIASTGDEILPFTDHAERLISTQVPAKSKVIQANVSHYVPLNRVSETGKQVLAQEMCTTQIEEDRTRLHGEIGEFVSEFFEEKL